MTRGWFRLLKPDSGRFGIRALRSSSFRRYAAVQLLSSISVSAQMVTELWLVYRITEEGLSLGTSTAIRAAPALVLAGVAGSLADRFPRTRLLTMTQAARCVIAAMFVLVTLGDPPAISTVYLLVLGLGCVHGIDAPVRRALVRDVVDRRDLPSAASLHTATISTGGIIGPLCAGLLLTKVGPVAGFAFSSASALAAVIFVQSLRLIPQSDDEPSPAAEAVPGPEPAPKVRIWSPELRPTFLLLGAFSVIGLNLNVLLPLIAEGVLGGGAGTYSVLFTCLRAGALVGSLLVAMRATRTTNFNRIVLALVLCGVALASVAAGTVVVAAAVTIVATGVCVGAFLSLTSAGIHMGADRAVQGRQVAVYSFIFIGGRSLGAPLTGWLADRLGTRWATLLLGLGTLLGALAVYAAVRRRLKPPV